jgi:transcriptional regulator with XRE-family HTH domain
MAKERLSRQKWAEIQTAYAGGIGLRELARNMGVPAGTILARAKREGWTQQIQSAKALGSPMQSLAITPMQSAAMSIQQRGQRHIERMAGVTEKGLDHVESMEGNAILENVESIEKLDKVARRTFGLDQVAGVGLQVNILSVGGCVRTGI